MQISQTISNLEGQPAAYADNILPINYQNVRTSSEILRSLNHKLRQQMVRVIGDEKKITVTDLYVRLRLEQSVASQHLAILRKAKIVLAHREGKFIFYKLNDQQIHNIDKSVKELVG